MGVTAETGPLITFGQGQGQSDYNADLGPNAWYQGDMLLDPRAQYTYQPGDMLVPGAAVGWLSTTALPLIDQVPSTASATNIASATPTTGVALALVSSSGAGITVGCSIINAATGLTVTGLLGIDVNAVRTATATFTNGSPKITWPANTMSGVQVGDPLTFTSSGTLPTGFALLTTYYVVAIGAGSSSTIAAMVSATPGGAPISAGSAGSGTQTANLVVPVTNTASAAPRVAFGQGGTGSGGAMAAWNPAWAVSRCIVVTSNGNDGSGFYTINGYDIYGYPMSQKLTGVSSTTATTTKAFKYIASVVPSGTIASTTLTVGTVDVFGLPLRTDYAQYLQVYAGGPPPLLVAAGSITFLGADITTPSSTTGDVRGTIVGGASDGTKRLYVTWIPTVQNMNSTVGLLGQTQA
jgi:hypothetical protein